MNNSFLIIFLVFLPSGILMTQIQNGGFEEYSSLPNSVGQYGKCNYWGNAGSATSTPDYYHYSGTMAGDIPETPVAYVDSWEGFAIMGATFFHVSHPNYREYISTEFSEALTPGKRYLFSFRLTNGNFTPLSNAGLAIDKIGFVFSEEAPVQIDNEPLNMTPHNVIDTVFYSKEWKKVKFILSADQEYNHLTFGVFGSDDDKTIEIREGVSPSIAYYFLDDFQIIEVDENFTLEQIDYNGSDIAGKEDDIIPDDNSTEFIIGDNQLYIPNAFSPNMDGDNDTFRPIIPDLKDYRFEIYSRWGELLFSTQNPNNGWDGSVKGGNAEADVYVWQISYSETNAENKMKTLHGTVSLIK